MDIISGAVFDLDDTIYFEREYVLSGFRFVAHALADGTAEAETAFAFLLHDFESAVRGNSFDRLLAQFPSLRLKWTVADVVALYRSHKPVIKMQPEVENLLDRLKRNGVRLALITDGPVASQSGKISALAADRFFAPILLTDLWGEEFRKPHPRAFQEVMRRWQIKPEQLIYIGDNPAKDFVAPRALGWRTARVRLEQQLRYRGEASAPEFAAELEFRRFSELTQWLLTACGLEHV